MHAVISHVTVITSRPLVMRDIQRYTTRLKCQSAVNAE